MRPQFGERFGLAGGHPAGATHKTFDGFGVGDIGQ